MTGYRWSRAAAITAVQETGAVAETAPEDGDISEVNASADMYGENRGVFVLTYYCACEICCDVETGITAAGREMAENVYSRHLYYTKLLIAAGVDRERAEYEGGRMDHILSDDSHEKLKKSIGPI